MNKYRIAAVVLFFLTATGICAAQLAADYQNAINNLDITAIKSLQIGRPSGGNYPATFHVLMNNKNKDAIRLIKGKFDIEFHDDRGGGDHLNIGEAKFSGAMQDYDFEILGNTLNKNVTLTVSNIPVDKIIRMINIIGDPDNNLRMTIKGDSEAGLQVARGWVTEKGKKYGVELNWHPQTQREVFME